MEFNLTSQFRRDSDFHTPYFYTVRRDAPCGSCVPDLSTFKKENKRKKKHLILAWFVSHCKTPGKREEYWERLSKYISGDKFGGCGNNSICHFRKSRWSHNCTMEADVLTNYKFYFSAENAICKDYVTGLLINAQCIVRFLLPYG